MCSGDSSAESAAPEVLFDRMRQLQGMDEHVLHPTAALVSPPLSISSDTGSIDEVDYQDTSIAPQDPVADYFGSFHRRGKALTPSETQGIDSVISVTDAWVATLDSARRMIAAGTPAADITGPFPTVTALYNQREFESTSVVNRWAARLVRSSRQNDYSFTSMACLWLVWHVLRPSIDTSSGTFAVSGILRSMSNSSLLEKLPPPTPHAEWLPLHFPPLIA